MKDTPMSYIGVNLPKPLMDQVDEILKLKGYTSRADFVKTAIRKLLSEENNRKEELI